MYLFNTEVRRVQYIINRTKKNTYNYIQLKLTNKEFKITKEVIKFLVIIYNNLNKK